MNFNGRKSMIVLGSVAVLTLAAAGGALAAGGMGGMGGHGGFGGFGGHGGPGGPGFGPRAGEMIFARLDADGNGLINAQDVAAGAAKRMAETDTNGDGQLDQSEIAAEMTARISERAAEHGWEAPDAKRIEWMAQGMILNQDEDDSGTLSLDEITPDGDRLARMIEHFDSDGDGALSEAEFDAARTRLAERAGHRAGPGPWGHGGWEGHGK